MSLNEFQKSQKLIQDKLDRITGKNKIFSNPMIKHLSLMDRMLPKIPKPLDIGIAKHNNILNNSALSELSRVTKNIQNTYNPILNNDWVKNYAKIFNTIDSSLYGNRAIEINNTISFTLKYLNYNFTEYIEDYDEEEKDEKTIIILEETSRVKKIITDIYYDNELLHKIHPREFEEIIAELLKNQGFEVELTKQTRDGGYDILALKYIDGFSKIKYLVECKRNSVKNKVGVDIIRGFRDVIKMDNAHKGIIATTSYFTKDAYLEGERTPITIRL